MITLSILGMGTLDWVEAAWIIVCSGICIYVIRARRKWKAEDRMRRRHGVNGRLKIYQEGKIRLYTIGTVKSFLYLILGLQSALVPPRTSAEPLTPFQNAVVHISRFTAALIIVANAALLALMLILDDRDRFKMVEADKEETPESIQAEMELYAKGPRNDISGSPSSSSGTDMGVSSEGGEGG